MQRSSVESGRATKQTNLFNGGVKIRKRQRSWSSGHDQLQHVGIGHPFNTTEIDHDHGNGMTHPGTATDQGTAHGHPLFKPLDGLKESGRIGRGKLFHGNPVIIDLRRRLDRKFFCDKQERPDSRWGLTCIGDGTD